jgi:hypothetical protein
MTPLLFLFLRSNLTYLRAVWKYGNVGVSVEVLAPVPSADPAAAATVNAAGGGAASAASWALAALAAAMAVGRR